MHLATMFEVPTPRSRRAWVRKLFRERFPAEARMAELEAYLALAERTTREAGAPMFPSLTERRSS